MAFRIEKSQRCTMCGTAAWEWQEDRYAYEPVINVCRGCEIKESTAETLDRKPGQTVELAPSRGVEAAKRHVRMERLYEKQRRDRQSERAR